VTEVVESTTRADARSGDHAGVGLGLAITAGIVTAHHGSIRTDTAPSGGARVTVALPPATPCDTFVLVTERTFSHGPADSTA